MKTYTLQGPARLEGELEISGAKNATLKMMAAALMIPGEVVLRRVPRITDVVLMIDVLRRLGARAALEGNTLTMDASGDVKEEATYELVSKMRASIQVLGPLLARLGRARVAMPGGDAIGSRPIDLHIKGLTRMGAKFTTEHGYVEGVADRLHGTRVLLEFPSVGATENLLMAGVLAEGTTVVENAAREPEIQDLASFLNAAGGRIAGAGTNTITIEGVDSLSAVEHEVLPDRIEAGTYAIAAAATAGDVTLRGVRPDHLELPLQKLEDAGAEISRNNDSVRVRMSGRPRPLDLVTLPYPGFPTDLQPPMMVLLSRATGPSILTENVFEARFLFVDEMNRMGSQIRVEGHHAVIKGVERMTGAPVRAPDIRAGAALVLCGLCAEGETVVYDDGHIERGYERFVDKLRGIGAPISVTESAAT
ncbi:MAG TPA: UDP-N-acetylglucosamine 1-carboxyvinyltransferase [Actinomycetota bacterium]|jgi:UDP-N-acetylglucosamine 1-carboxyvinyltransferase|nr:UDP-N-acetylglucosamine 1-carboxyvinyltransferase [Actinomycetota bacterium]